MMAVSDQPPLNPVEAEQHLWRFGQDIARGVRIVSDAEEAFTTADREYDRAKARAQLAADGKTVADREAQVELATVEERDAKDVAWVAYQHAKRTMKAIESQLTAVQSIAADLRQQYSVAGVRER